MINLFVSYAYSGRDLDGNPVSGFGNGIVLEKGEPCSVTDLESLRGDLIIGIHSEEKISVDNLTVLFFKTIL